MKITAMGRSTLSEDSIRNDINAEDENSRTSIPSQSVSSTPSEFTDIIGSKGRWQNRILIITLIGVLPCPWNHMGIGFLAYKQDYWCSRPQHSNISVREWWDKNIPNETIDGTTRHSQCKIYVNDTSSDGGGNETRRIEGCKKWEFDTTYKSTITEKWNLVCNEEWMISMSQSVYMGGFLTAAIILGQLSDRYGRHPIIMLNVVIIIFSGIGTAFSTSFIMFIIMRFFVAMGNSGLNLITFVLMIELVGARHRLYYTFVQSVGWNIGYVSLPFFAWLVQDWFYLQLIITLPSFLYISYYWILPESPRWLLTQGEIDKATKIMEEAVRVNKKDLKNLEIEAKKLFFVAEKSWSSDDELVPEWDLMPQDSPADDLVNSMQRRCGTCIAVRSHQTPDWTLVHEGMSLQLTSPLATLLNYSEEEANKKTSVCDLLRTINLRKKTLILFFIWIVNAFVYYGLSLNTDDLGGNFYLNFFLSGAVEFPASVISFFALRRFGRRIPLMIFLICAGASCVVCIFINDDLLWLRITFAMMGKLCISSSFSVVYIYSAELFPTVARNVGVGSSSTCARIGSMVAPFMKELGKYTNPSVPMGLFGGLSVVSGLLVLLLPETSGHPVPETLQQAEAFGKNMNDVSIERDKIQLQNPIPT